MAFGDLKPKDKILFGKFIEDLELTAWKVYYVRDNIEGVAIAEDKTIADKEIVFFEKECFIFHMNYVFDSAPYIKKKDEDENGLHPFNKEGLNDYILSAIHFMNAEHTQLFELKARKWAGEG